jgi:hypothetical protein
MGLLPQFLYYFFFIDEQDAVCFGQETSATQSEWLTETYITRTLFTLCCAQSSNIVCLHLQPTFPPCLLSDFSCHVRKFEWEIRRVT